MADAAMGAKVPAKNPHAVIDDAAAVDFPMPLDPLVEVAQARRPSAAEEARTIVAGSIVGTLASLTSAGDPWASVVTYGQLDDGQSRSVGGEDALGLDDLLQLGEQLTLGR